jgi:hypothetical protein
MMTGFRTILFNILVGGTLIVRAFAPEAEVPSQEELAVTADTVDKYLAAVYVAGNVILRFVTKTPVFNRNKAEAKDDGGAP